MKRIQITKEKGEKIIEMHRKKIDQKIIANETDCSQSYISFFTRAYDGDKEQFNRLPPATKEVLLEIKKNMDLKNSFPIYECKILFGLLTIKFKPINS